MPDKAIHGLFEAGLHRADGHLAVQPGETATSRGKQLRIATAGQHQADSFPRASGFN
ncbi:hypothetical protein ACVW1C_006654 [Bradyrhizobium sp. USDA 4011]